MTKLKVTLGGARALLDVMAREGGVSSTSPEAMRRWLNAGNRTDLATVAASVSAAVPSPQQILERRRNIVAMTCEPRAKTSRTRR